MLAAARLSELRPTVWPPRLPSSGRVAALQRESEAMAVTFKHLRQDVDRNGNIRTYLRVPGRPAVRLRSPVGSPEFAEEYAAAAAGQPLGAPKRRPQAAPGVLTFERLVEGFLASEDFKEGRQADARYRIKTKLRWACGLPVQKARPEGQFMGDKPISTFDTDFVAAIFNRCEKRGVGFRVKQILQLLFDWGIQNHHREVRTNPARDYRPRIRRPAEKRHKRWTEVEIAQFRAFYPIGTMPRLAMELIFESAARRSDVWRLGPQHVSSSNVLSFTPKKTAGNTDVKVDVMLSDYVRRIIAATPAAHEHLRFIIGDRGRPFTRPEDLGRWFSRKAREAGLPEGFTAHGLRRSAATEAARAGCTDDELMALGGWTDINTARKYIDEANREGSGKAASSKRLAYRQAGPAPSAYPTDRDGAIPLASKALK